MTGWMRFLPWNWNVEWKSLLPWNWGKAAPVSHAGQYTLDLALPGMRPEEVEVCIEGRDLVIRAQHDEDEERMEGGYRVRRVSRGAFVRRVHLPGDVDAEEVQAMLEDGLLTVSLPRLPADPGGPRRIPVHQA